MFWISWRASCGSRGAGSVEPLLALGEKAKLRKWEADWPVPIEGYLVDRLGPRRMLAMGGVLVGLGWIGAGRGWDFAHARDQSVDRRGVFVPNSCR